MRTVTTTYKSRFYTLIFNEQGLLTAITTVRSDGVVRTLDFNRPTGIWKAVLRAAKLQGKI